MEQVAQQGAEAAAETSRASVDGVNGGSAGQHLPSACRAAALVPTECPVWLLWERSLICMSKLVKDRAGQWLILWHAHACVCVCDVQLHACYRVKAALLCIWLGGCTTVCSCRPACCRLLHCCLHSSGQLPVVHVPCKRMAPQMLQDEEPLCEHHLHLQGPENPGHLPCRHGASNPPAADSTASAGGRRCSKRW